MKPLNYLWTLLLAPYFLCAGEEAPLLNVYFGGPLFNAKDLVGNLALARSIEESSEGRYHCILPQDATLPATTPQDIRDGCIRSVLAADLAIFNLDGTDLDSGTVAEFMFAKFADIPTVLLRTDFRKGGDQDVDPWNLMISFFPRTEVVLIDSMTVYKADTSSLISEVANQVVNALDKVYATKSLMPQELSESVYQWLSLLPGFKENTSEEVLSTHQKKTER